MNRYAGGLSTGYRGVSRRLAARPSREVPERIRERPALTILTRPVRCDGCGALRPAGTWGRYYGGKRGAKFYGETCHAKGVNSPRA